MLPILYTEPSTAALKCYSYLCIIINQIKEMNAKNSLTLTAYSTLVILCTQRLHIEYEPTPMSSFIS